MNKKILTTAISLLFVSSVGAQRGNTRWTAEGISLNRPVPELRSASDGDVDYSDGVFIVNEDWYGHQNSTVNFLTNQGNGFIGLFKKKIPGVNWDVRPSSVRFMATAFILCQNRNGIPEQK